MSARGLRLEEHEPARPAAVAIGPGDRSAPGHAPDGADRVGDASAFEELYERFYLRARGVAWSVCRDDGRAEEAVQESFTSNMAPRLHLSGRARNAGRMAAHPGA